MGLELNIVNITFLLLVVPFALVMEGIRRKTVARMQNRIGPPIWQPIYDVLKLFKKGRSDTLAKENPFFKIIPVIAFLIALTLFFFIPFSIVSFQHDFIFLIYLLVLESALFVLAGFAANNPYSAIASMRELILMVCYEMIFAIVIITIFVFENVLTIAQFDSSLLLWKLPLAFICFIAVAAVEIRITPYDTVDAPTEVLEGMENEYSGKGLAFLKMADALKMTFFAFLILYFFIGSLNFILLALTPLAVMVFAFIQATTGRYRVDQTFKRLTIFLALALIEIIRIKFIIW
ncbi:MAG: NADH-quinone oxidoreductase subunit H [Nanoarchaeota archaeon]|nr:NADH-quinone oxidoreductase subunit H [Nanoarchaeota archaeon]